MPPRLSTADVATLIDEANRAARRLHRKLHLPQADLEDLSQDLLLDLICRLPGFDARRGSIGAFANIVLRNQSSRIAMRIQRERRAHDGWMFSLDAPMAGSREPLKNLLLEEDGLASWYGLRPFDVNMQVFQGLAATDRRPSPGTHRLRARPLLGRFSDRVSRSRARRATT